MFFLAAVEIPLIKEIVVIFALATAVILICNKFKIPAIVGLLLTGVIAGPHGLGLVSDIEPVEMLAEIGVILLLFTIGLEFSLKELAALKKSVFIGGGLQVGFSVLAGLGCSMLLGIPFEKAIFLGFLLSLSSTAIVLKVLQERGEISTQHGKNVLAMLIFQDIIAIPMILFAPILAGKADNVGLALGVLGLKAVGLVVIVLFVARYVMPKLLFMIASTRNRELFLLSVVGLCFAVAFITSMLELSLALGAFLAGLVISESEYSHQAFAIVLPFRDIFTSFFFVSIGMLLNAAFLLENFHYVFGAIIFVLFTKTILTGAAVRILGYNSSTALLAALAMSQIGEFSFIIAKAGIAAGLLTQQDDFLYQMFLAVSVLTMSSTPFIIAFSQKVNALVHPKKQINFAEQLTSDEIEDLHSLQDHLIIVGFGVNGRNLACAAKSVGVKYVVLEMNPETVRREKEKGENIYFGDAQQPAVLEHVGISKARVLVIAIPDGSGTRAVVHAARELNSGLHIIARTRYLTEMKPLLDIGASEVVPEEYETSVEIFTRVLRTFLIPMEEIRVIAADIRADGYQMLRSASAPAKQLKQSLDIPDLEVVAQKIAPRAQAVGLSLIDLDMRKKFGASVLAFRRNGVIQTNPSPQTVFQEHDVVYIVGNSHAIEQSTGLFQSQE